jgi:ABC-type amino acid transport substrate-binding protein
MDFLAAPPRPPRMTDWKTHSTGTPSVLRNLNQVLLSLLLMVLIMTGTPIQASAATAPATLTPGDADRATIDLDAKPRLNPSIQAIRDSGILRIGLAYPDNLPLYGHDKDGNLIGYDVDLARGIARALRVKPVFSQPQVTYTRLVQLASADQVDVALGKLSVTIPRLGYAQPVPYLNLHQSLLINRRVLESIGQDPANIGPRLLAAPIRIGVIEGSAYSVWGPSTLPRARFTTYPNWQACVDALTSRQVDALMRDSFETARLVKSKPKLALEYVPIILKDKVDNIAMYVGPRMEGLEPIGNFYVNITTGVLDESELFRHFKAEMKSSQVSTGSKSKSQHSDSH